MVLFVSCFGDPRQCRRHHRYLDGQGSEEEPSCVGRAIGAPRHGSTRHEFISSFQRASFLSASLHAADVTTYVV